MKKMQAGRHIRLIEFVCNVPSDGAEFTTLFHNRMHVTHDEKQLFPVCVPHSIQGVLHQPQGFVSRGAIESGGNCPVH